MIKERPILFSSAMVRAILDGRKTQTRRVVKGFSLELLTPDNFTPEYVALPENAASPYGYAGDRLWVKETFRFTSDFDGDGPARVGERCLDAGYRAPWAPIQYDADGERRDWKWVGTPPVRDVMPGKTRVSIHMPRWASRILLEITGVRVERLAGCSEADAIAEGIELEGDGWKSYAGGESSVAFATTSYASLWDSINGPGAWETNPWVWVVKFRRLYPELSRTNNYPWDR